MKKGFTLIELLVVVLIIGILSAVALPQYQKVILKTRLATLKDMVEAIAQAQEVYYMANGGYATELDDLDIQPPDGGALASDGGKACSISDPTNIKCSYLDSKGKRVVTYLRFYINLNRDWAGKSVCQSKKNGIGEAVCKQDTGKKTCPYWEEDVATCFYD